MPDRPWEKEAANWVQWVRTPGHDVYAHYAPAFFDHIVPETSCFTLEIGCGEGRVARDLAARGHRVTAIDSAPTLIRHAAKADSDSRYALADAESLPFPDGSFDLVVAYNSLMDVEDMPAAVSEATRVLKPGGHFCVCVLHPICDAGAFTSREPNAPFVIEGTYFGKRPYHEKFERDGLTMTFHSWCYALEDYAAAFLAAGLLIESLREPAAPQSAVASRASIARWRRVPNFLFVRALKP